MSEFKYPMWFKCIEDGAIFKFVIIDCAYLIDKGLSTIEDEKVGDFVEGIINHTNRDYWEDVTDQYKDKAEIPPLEMCGAPLDVEKKTHNKYKRKVPRTEIDVYDILKAFNVVNPATQHAIKKLLCAGDRGYKDKVQDLKEAYASIERAIELESDNVEA